MRASLLNAARKLFIELGFANTTTPRIVKQAGVTRGALYHHFEDKTDLFRAVAEAESTAVADEIEQATKDLQDPRQALLQGATAYFSAMQAEGRCQLLLIDGPAVLGRAAMDRIDQQSSARTLLDGLKHAAQHGAIKPVDPELLSAILSGAFDRAALLIKQGADEEQIKQIFTVLIDGILQQ